MADLGSSAYRPHPPPAWRFLAPPDHAPQFGTRTLGSTVARVSIALVAVAALLACSRQDKRFVDPAATFATYLASIRQGDVEAVWECYSQGYRDQHFGGQLSAWEAEWKARERHYRRVETRREISEERIINKQVGYLLFDSTTLPSQNSSPFFYFIREKEGWKITSHLDSTFHQALERAIAQGEYQLPTRP